ncbi:hypothetical protein ACH3XW_46265 [Acanthocheilonema viteae]
MISEIQEIPPSNDLLSTVEEMRPLSDPIIIWRNSKTENISRTPEENYNGASTEHQKLENHSTLTTDYHCKGDQKFLEQDYRGAYANFLCAMKIISEHGNIDDEFGRDTKMLRVFQDKCCLCFWALYRKEKQQVFLNKCIECYNKLIEKDLCHPFWYKRRATLLRDEYQNHISAYKDFVVFTILMDEYDLILTEEEMNEISSCFNEAEEMAWSLEKNKMMVKKPFLTSDWINLWALCPCDDVLLQDLLFIREEDKNPQNKSTLVESAYKDALKQIARGYHSMAVNTLLHAYAQRQGIYRCEAFLLLALIYSQLNNNEVDYYLDTFVDLWRVDQHRVPLPRRKQIFMRYMSLSRAVSQAPFQDLDLSMFTPQEQARFYTQIALTTVLSLKILCGSPANRLTLNKWNLTKLEIIENSCDRAIKADKKFLYARMLREYTVMEIAQADNLGRHCKCALATLTKSIEGIQHQFKSEHRSFALWCLFSAHFINHETDAAIKCGLELQKDLLYPGSVISFLINNKYSLKGKIDVEDVQKRIIIAEERLEYDPENFRLYLDTATLYEHLLVFFNLRV